MYFTLLYFTFYGMMAVGLTPNYHIASIVSSAFYAIWNLFSGFIIPRPVSAITFGSPRLLLFSAFRSLTIPRFTLKQCTESSNLVEMVLLGMPRSVDTVRAGCLTVRWCHNADGGRHSRERLYRGLLRLQAQLVRLCCYGGRGVRGAVCLLVQFCHHEAQLPEEVDDDDMRHVLKRNALVARKYESMCTYHLTTWNV